MDVINEAAAPNHRRRGVLAALLTLPWVTLTGSAQTALPRLGDGGDMGLGEERKLGDEIARDIYRDPDYLDDPVIGEYVQGVWQPLLAAASKMGGLTPEMQEQFAWQVLLIRDREVNAFALPGGYMGVNLGLLGLVASRDELASVMGHELSHITQRHISRLIAQEGKQTPLLLAAMLLAVLVAGRSPDAAGALMTGGQAAAIQSQLNFSRDMEREADRVGFGVMVAAGFNPRGFVTMFEKLQQATRLTDDGSYPYLRNHPLTTERIADMQARQQQAAPNAGDPPLTLAHAMVSARARFLANTEVAALRSWIEQANAMGARPPAPPVQAGMLYGAVLAQMRSNNAQVAAPLIQQLQGLTQADPAAARLVQLLQFERLQAMGDAAAVAAQLPVPLSPIQRPELLLSTQAATQVGKPKEAIQALQVWVTSHPTDALAWQTLAGAYTAQGDTLSAIRADAESHVAHLDYSGAVDRMKAAQELIRKGRTTDFIEASIIEARAREINALFREQSLKR